MKEKQYNTENKFTKEKRKLYEFYQCLLPEDEIVFHNQRWKMSFNKYMAWLNELEAIGYIKMKEYKNYLTKEKRVVVIKK